MQRIVYGLAGYEFCIVSGYRAGADLVRPCLRVRDVGSVHVGFPVKIISNQILDYLFARIGDIIQVYIGFPVKVVCYQVFDYLLACIGNVVQIHIRLAVQTVRHLIQRVGIGFNLRIQRFQVGRRGISLFYISTVGRTQFGIRGSSVDQAGIAACNSAVSCHAYAVAVHGNIRTRLHAEGCTAQSQPVTGCVGGVIILGGNSTGRAIALCIGDRLPIHRQSADSVLACRIQRSQVLCCRLVGLYERPVCRA